MRNRTIFLAIALIAGIAVGIRVHRGSPSRARILEVAHNTNSWKPHIAVTRINYPYSVIPYGVEAPEELKNAMVSDEAIAKHFQGFDFRHAHFIVLDKDACAYVSFKKDKKIRWTQKCVALHRGEKIYTDGFYMIRALCGNQVSYTPQAPSAPVALSKLGPVVNPDEMPGAVAPETASQAPAVPATVAKGSAPPPIGSAPGAPPIVIAGGPPTIPIVIPPGGGGSCCRPSTPHGPPGPPGPPPGPPGPPINVPEGSGTGMMLLAVAAIGTAFLAKRR